MNKFIFSLFLPLTVISLSGWAGNGTFTVQCGTNSTLLDYVEATAQGRDILKFAGNTLDEKMESAFKTLQNVDPNRAKTYRFLYSLRNEKALEIKFTNLNGLVIDSTQVQDPVIQKNFGLGNIQIPTNCNLGMISNQSDRTIKIFKPAWDKISVDQQVGVMLHELFFYDALENDHTDSIATRKLNGLLASKSFANFTIDTWLKVIQDSKLIPKFPYFKVDRDMIDPTNIYPDAYGDVDIYGQKLSVATNDNAYFEDGLIPDMVKLTSKQSLNLSSLSKYPLTIYGEKDGATDFWLTRQDGKCLVRNLNGFYLEKYENPNIKFSGLIWVRFGDEVKFPNGRVQSRSISLFMTDSSILQLLKNGKWVNVKGLNIDLKTNKISED